MAFAKTFAGTAPAFTNRMLERLRAITML